MEFYFLGFLTGISVDVFYLNYFGNVFDDAYYSFELVDFDDIDQLLLEEFVKTGIALFSEFGILFEVFLHLNGQHMNKVLSSGVLNWDFNDLFSVVGHLDDTVNN